MTTRSPLRLWPGVTIVVLMALARFVTPLVAPDAAMFAMMSGPVGGVAIFVWWTFFSRAAPIERWGGAGLMLVALPVVRPFLHESVATAGMGVMFFLLALPLLGVALVLWAVVTPHLPDGTRRVALVATLAVASGGWTLVRTGGITGTAESELAWRWSATPEERLLAQGASAPVPAVTPRPTGLLTDVASGLGDAVATLERPAPWPGFRGGGRNSVVPRVRIETDWEAAPPVEVWRRPVGPGWSSFSVHDGVTYTQEQRGEDEVVAAYDLATGAPVWMHRDAARFWESNGGAGPRGTPTIHAGRVYTLGATGILNALDARDGQLIWSRDAAADTGATTPVWGFSGSPLVVDDRVVVATSSTLAAYDLLTGDPVWFGPSPDGGEGYSSPQLLTVEGFEQIVLMGAAGAVAVEPTTGAVLWDHLWMGAPIVQPAPLPDGDLLVSTAGASGAVGLRRLSLDRGPRGWVAEEQWTSNGLKPYFNDYVVHEGHAYGFDGSILAAVDLSTGERRWKGGRYGHGQMVLLPAQDLLLVLSERGEVALVGATPEGYQEMARMPAIEGKTWNHPVVVDDLLLVRNDREMAAFRLTRTDECALVTSCT